MKVLITADGVGGVWTYAVELAQALAKSRVQVAIATMGPQPTPNQRAQVAVIPGAKLYTSEYKLEWMDDPWSDVDDAGDWLLGLEQSFKPDVVHLNGYAHGALPWKAPTLIAAHSCVLSWWLAVKGEPAPEQDWQTYRTTVRAGIHAADHVVAPTLAMLDSVQQLYGRTTEISVIPNGRDPSLFYCSPRKEPFIVSCGRLWDEGKNIGALDRIADDLDWPVCLVGNATAPSGEFNDFRSRACCHLGQLSPEAFAQFLGRAAIFCLPARYEPFGLSVLEAALSGCALVLGDIPSLRETWDGAAVFVPPGSDQQLAESLTDVIHSPAERTALGASAKRRALQFTATRTASQYFNLYAALLDGASSGTRKEATACAS